MILMEAAGNEIEIDGKKYYILHDKSTGSWNICSRNPPLEPKDKWAEGFDTEEEARKYLKETLSNLKVETLMNRPSVKIVFEHHAGVKQRPTGITYYNILVLGLLSFGFIAVGVLSLTNQLPNSSPSTGAASLIIGIALAYFVYWRFTTAGRIL